MCAHIGQSSRALAPGLAQASHALPESKYARTFANVGARWPRVLQGPRGPNVRAPGCTLASKQGLGGLGKCVCASLWPMCGHIRPQACPGPQALPGRPGACRGLLRRSVHAQWLMFGQIGPGACPWPALGVWHRPWAHPGTQGGQSALIFANTRAHPWACPGVFLGHRGPQLASGIAHAPGEQCAHTLGKVRAPWPMCSLIGPLALPGGLGWPLGLPGLSGWIPQ